MALQVIPNDVNVQGTLSATNFQFPSQQITDAAVNAAANIAATKLQHRREPVYAQSSTTTATADTKTIHIVYGSAASAVAFRAGSIVANVGAATVTVDLRKNGSSVLTSIITLNSSNTARVPVSAAIATAGAVAGDVVEVVVTATAGGGTLAQGVFAQVVIDETAN